MRLRFVLLSLLLSAQLAHAQDASYALTPAAADKWVRATQQLVVGGATPNMQGNLNPANLANVKAALDGNPAAQQALTAAGITSSEYVSFLSAAMTAMMVGQMEMAGVRGMLPPGVTTRPSQQNIDFMKSNADLFERSMRPGAPTAAAPAASVARAAAGDEALPLPDAAADVLPSSVLARLLPLDSITDRTDCTLGAAEALIEKELAETQALEREYYGNPGDSGLARTPAEGAILERLEDSDLESCGVELNMGLAFAPEYQAADQAWSAASSRIVEEEQAAWAACPGISGGKEPACERRVEADAARKRAAAQREFLAAISRPYAARVEALRACTLQREAVVADAKTANVRGANVKLVLRPLTVAWQQIMFPTAEWRGICESAQRYLQE
jgi:hypothetical protein